MSVIETPTIELKDAEVFFTLRTGSLFKPSKVHAAYGINLSVLRGRAFGLVGESGCGKSTTVNVICGPAAFIAGKVYFDGEEVTKRTAQARRRTGRAVSVVSQDPTTALNLRMIVCNQLVDPMRVYKIGAEEEHQKRVMELISMVGLPPPALETLPGQPSGGQRQHAAIARAPSLNPDAIIADEPTSALDVSIRAQVLNLLTDLKRELNLTMAFIFHDTQTVRYIPDHIAVMNKGLVVEEGPARQLLENPKDPYTHTLLSIVPLSPHPTLEGE